MEVVRMLKTITLHGKKLVGGKAKGEALVCPEPIAFYGGIDPDTGVGVEPNHALEGICVTGKILVYPTGKGSTANCNYLYDMSFKKTAPAALIMVEPDPIQIVGSIMGKIPVISSKENPVETISTGDFVEVDSDNGTITVTKK